MSSRALGGVSFGLAVTAATLAATAAAVGVPAYTVTFGLHTVAFLAACYCFRVAARQEGDE